MRRTTLLISLASLVLACCNSLRGEHDDPGLVTLSNVRIYQENAGYAADLELGGQKASVRVGGGAYNASMGSIKEVRVQRAVLDSALAHPDKYELAVLPDGAVVLALRAPQSSTPQPRCWEGHPEAITNIDWVLAGDAGALERYRDARGDDKSPFEALLSAQEHNDNAQRTIRDLGKDCVEEYVKYRFGDR